MPNPITRLNTLAQPLGALDDLVPSLARLVFASVLLTYFWASGLTKLGDGILGIFQPSVGAYAQIFPKVTEAVLYDTSQLSLWHWLVVMAGTWAEFILPALILVGLLTRYAALGMIGFITVQSLTDLYGHGVIEHAPTVGKLFDRIPNGVILDQRLLWVFLLLVLVIKGGGLLSLDQLFRNAPSARPASQPQ